LDEVLVLARPGRLDGNLRIGEIIGIRSGGKEHCLAARQELRPAVAAVLFLETSQWLRCTSTFWHLLEN
jgi:hypothetical protein